MKIEFDVLRMNCRCLISDSRCLHTPRNNDRCAEYSCPLQKKAANNKEPAQQHLTKVKSEPERENCRCIERSAWIQCRKKFSYVDFDFCPSCGKLLLT